MRHRVSIIGAGNVGTTLGLLLSRQGYEIVDVVCRIDTQDELDYYANGGILQYVLRHLAA